ncbi:MAG: DUF3307 domain-containing protein [Verrucomicrobiales bacterium]
MTFHPILATLPLDVANLTDALKLFFAFGIAHAVADFPLQGAFLSKHKNRNVPPPSIDGFGELPSTLWIYCLTAHSLVHAGFVWILTGSAALGLAEFLVHWLIDFAKSEKWTSFHLDQFLHILTKVFYVGLIWAGLFP